ncbi:MAG: hypothetical protein JST92_01480 [Deltaproteobacteria bacterium]|nr:hypothetical protein [Deltaproteobacteria bacterium]
MFTSGTLIGPSLRAFALALSLALTACITAGPAQKRASALVDSSQFPSRAEVDGMSHTILTAPATLVRDPGTPVAEWTLAGPLPEQVSDAFHAPASPYEELFARVARQKSAELLESMHCAARELGRFILAKKDAPTDELRRFIAARCGVPGHLDGLSFQLGQADEKTSDTSLVHELHDSLEQSVAKVLEVNGLLVGAWMGRDGNSFVTVLVSMPRAVKVAPVAFVPKGPTFELVGEVSLQTDRLQALVNHGPYGVAPCTPDPSVKPPKFSLVCPVDQADETAWVELVASSPDSALDDSVLPILLFPAGKPSAHFSQADAAKPSSSAAPGSAPTSDAQQFVDALNQVRHTAGMGAVGLAQEEQATADALTPRYCHAALDPSTRSDAEKLALGLAAGWSIKATIEYGSFGSGVVAGKDETARTLLAEALERPSGRQTLLDPAVTKVAAGFARQADHDALCGTYVSWRLYLKRPGDVIAKEIAARVAKLRQRRGLPPMQLATYLNDLMTDAAASVANNEKDPKQALNDLLEAATGRTGHDLRGWYFEASRLEDLEFPGDFFEGELVLALHAGFYKPAGAAWGRHGVFMLLEDTKVAAKERVILDSGQ